ncbi:hypothetical protein BDR26DRAFT_880564 [Obelidium mucronatum]|nr:hypothetical protein BDR26DRAFT_880564 [Obelidium mucronatum]
MTTNNNLKTTFTLDHDNISDFHQWVDDIEGVAAQHNVLHTIRLDQESHDDNINNYLVPYGPNGAITADPQLLELAVWDNPEDPNDPWVLQLTDVPNTCPGSYANNKMMQRINWNISAALLNICQQNTKCARTWIRNLQTYYNAQTRTDTKETIKEWITLQHLSHESISEYYNRFSNILTKMRADPTNAAFRPFVNLTEVINHVIDALYKQSFGHQIQRIKSLEITNLSDLLKELLETEKMIGFKPKKTANDFALLLGSGQPNGSSNFNSNGTGRGGFRGRGRGRAQNTQWNRGGGNSNRGGYVNQGRQFPVNSNQPTHRLHALEFTTQQPPSPCKTCGGNHFHVQCFKSQDYPFNALLPFPQGKPLLPPNRIRNDIVKHPLIQQLLSKPQNALFNAPFDNYQWQQPVYYQQQSLMVPQQQLPPPPAAQQQPTVTFQQQPTVINDQQTINTINTQANNLASGSGTMVPAGFYRGQH